ncbi:MAG: transcriptional regulator, LacI family [Frankiales bacterium]|nr:transcriptional regulator, LacI family [Frankiales bacterium]
MSTLVEVANAAGVSRQTVSNVINAPHRVAPETRDVVNREIVRLGYKPNRAARALRRRRADALGIQVNAPGERRLGDILDSFLVELTLAARRHSFHVVTFAIDSHDDPIAEYEHLLSVQMVDGFVLTNTRHEDPRPSWLLAQEVPFVSFGRIWDDPSVTSWVDVDGFSGVAAGVRHLHAQGYERVGFLGWPDGSPVGDDRRAGWLEATGGARSADYRLQAVAPQEIHAAAAAAAPLLATLGGGGALICASDTLALGAWTAMRSLGMTPGVDVGLVGFDDTDVARSFDISSLRQPLTDIAETMVDLIADHGVTGAPRRGQLLQPVVVQRASSTRKPH